jgi:hypothetical protein
VHNFYGYLSSQTMQGLAPNPFQMLLFMYSADVILMDIPLGLGSWANLIAGTPPRSLLVETLADHHYRAFLSFSLLLSLPSYRHNPHLQTGKLIGQNLLGMSAEYKEFSDDSE